jgi:hypothetical protein
MHPTTLTGPLPVYAPLSSQVSPPRVLEAMSDGSGWEDRVTAPVSTATFFAAGSPHQVIAPNKVIELKKNYIVLEKPFEGSNEVSFAVSSLLDCRDRMAELIGRNVSSPLALFSLLPCAPSSARPRPT